MLPSGTFDWLNIEEKNDLLTLPTRNNKTFIIRQKKIEILS